MDTSTLRDVLAKVAARLQAHRDLYQANETAVREQIVLPILRSLGWDIENPDEVHPEERSDVGSPDYTLKSSDRAVLTIEVKKTQVDVTQPGALEQAHRYASAKGVGLCLATNGEAWVLARSFEEGRDLRGRILWQVLLSDGTIDAAISKLAFIAKSNVGSIDNFVRLQDRMLEEWEHLLEDPVELVSTLVNLLRKRLGADGQQLPYQGFVEDFVSQRVREMLDEEHAEPDATAAATAATGDSSVPRRGSAAEILVAAAEKAIRERRLGPTDSIESGHSRYLVSPRPTHKHGRGFFNPRRLSNGLYLETHSSIDNAKRQAAIIDGYGRGRGR